MNHSDCDVPLDDLPPLHRELAQDLGLVRQGRLIGLWICPGCFALAQASCARCAQPACGACDLCGGCGRVVCPSCNSAGTPQFAFPGDRYLHPHDA